MAGVIPENMVIQPWSSSQGKYISFTAEPASVRGYVACDGDTVFNTLSRIAVERTSISSKFFHLRFTHSNRYWSRRGPGPQDHFIVASADQPEEDTSKLTCTLFQLTVADAGSLLLTHVQSGGRVRVDLQANRVYVEDSNRRDASDVYTFRMVDWATLVRMPTMVSFKGDNNKFLRVEWSTLDSVSTWHLKFASDDGNEEKAAHEVSYTYDGHVRIAPLYDPRQAGDPDYRHGHWFAGSSSWVAAYVNGTETRGRGWFWPVKVDDRTIAFRDLVSNMFCSRHTQGNEAGFLQAAENNMSTQARFVVSERVLDRSIYDVRYRLEDARIYDERPFVVGIGVGENVNATESSLAITVSEEVTETSSFSNSLSIMAGVKTEIKSGIPFIAEGKIEISTEVTDTLEWGSSTETKRTVGATYTVSVPPKSRARINYVATHGKCNIPFSYTQRDRSSFDGQFVTSAHDDGIFNGVSYYSFRFEELEIQPLF